MTVRRRRCDRLRSPSGFMVCRPDACVRSQTVPHRVVVDMARTLLVIALVTLATPGNAQHSSNSIACATADLLSEKAVCAWELYRSDAVWVARAISRALIAVDGIQASMEPQSPNAARDLLVESQEAWEDYREAACRLESHLYFGGEGTALAYATCLHRLTEARARDLRILLQEE